MQERGGAWHPQFLHQKSQTVEVISPSLEKRARWGKAQSILMLISLISSLQLRIDLCVSSNDCV